MHTTSFLHSSRGAPAHRPPRSLPVTTRTLTRFALATSLLALASGCASQYKFGVDAINQVDESIARQSYRLVDARPDANANDPDFDRIARDVETALSSKGLYAAPNGTTPQLVIEVDVGISAPIVTEGVRTEPVYLPIASDGRHGLGHAGSQMGFGALPRYIGERDITYRLVTYQKFLRLTALESDQIEGVVSPRQVWSVHVTNKDASDNLAVYTRLMVAAAMDSVGRDLSSQQHVVLDRRDCRVEFVAQGMKSS